MQINQHFCWLQKSQHKLILQPQTHQASCCHLCGHKQRSELYVLIPHHSVPGLAPCLAQTQNQRCLQQTQNLWPPGPWCITGSHSEQGSPELQSGVNEKDHGKTNASRSFLIQKLCSVFPTTTIRHLILQCIGTFQPADQGPPGILR